MIETGFYQPIYYNEKTPFDDEYNGNLNSVGNIENREFKRNKYQYNRNKAIQNGYIKPIVENKQNAQAISLVSEEEWLKRLRRQRMGL